MLNIAEAEIDEKSLATICEKYGIAELAVFGSAARGETRSDSDIDLLYTLHPGRRLGWEIEELSDELSAVLGRPVDLVSRRSLHSVLKPTVLAEARAIHAA